MTPDHAPEDRELDELLQAVRARFVDRSDVVFDFEAGLADVRERADPPFARVPVRRPRGGPGPRVDAVALACEHLEELVIALGCLLLAGPFPDLIGSHIQRAADVLLALRDEIQAGSASLARAAPALAQVRDELGQADLVLRVEMGTPLDDALAAHEELAGLGTAGRELRPDTASWLERLEHDLAAALPVSDRGRAAARRSAPGKRGDDAERRRRRAGGC
jgi:hypothetical protein